MLLLLITERKINCSFMRQLVHRGSKFIQRISVRQFYGYASA